MSLKDQLNSARGRLQPTTTVVLLEDGKEVVEYRNEVGEFVQESADSSEVEAVSNRRRKKVERAKRMGYVIDLQPDLQLANICPGVYLGSQDVAADLAILQSEGISHIVNCASGVPNFYPTKFKYLQLEVLDLPWTDIVCSFSRVHDFMRKCVDDGGKVLVHCNAGISRAATFVVSYLMVQRRMSLQCALETVKKARPKVRPNAGFMKQLTCFEESLSTQML